MSLFDVIMTAALIIVGLAVFYLVIRMKDVLAALNSLGDKLPVSDQMRREAASAMASLNERMGALGEKARQIGDVSNQVKELRNLFMLPKGAGGAGERILEKTLSDVLPVYSYQPQYKLRTGTVDFVIKFKECVVPIDSKLSLEDYNRMLASPDDASRRGHWKSFVNAVKKRIDETSKYILPDEKTTDFAFMYVASEGVYYEAFIKDKQFGEANVLYDYAIRKRIYPVSPLTIYPYLAMILEGMKALKIEENAREILNRVSGLRNDYERFRNIYNIIITHIEDAHSKHASEAHGALTKLDQHISGLEHRKGA